MILAFLKGLGVGAGLIVAIGAQNAFVLSQGIRKNHSLAIALICSLSDLLLICIGITGIGAALAQNPGLTSIATTGGALFLFYYGLQSFISAHRGGSIDTSLNASKSLKGVISATLAVTFLNPHIYIDTIILMGGISARFNGQARYIFAAGAITASFIWFFALSFGGRALAPLFKNPLSWKILDSIVGITMWMIGLSLLLPLQT